MAASAQPSFSFVVDWLDGETSIVPCYFCVNHDGERITEAGAATLDQQDRAASYLTHVPSSSMSRPPQASLPIPTDEVELALSITAQGVQVSLWIIEFDGAQQVAKTSWPVPHDKTVSWKPHPACKSIRLGWRLQGVGALASAHLELRAKGHEARETAHLMDLWRALNAPKHTLGTLAALDGPVYLGPDPEVVTQAAAATHAFFATHHLDASRLVLDGGALDGVSAPAVWPHQQEAIAECAYRWVCPFTGEAIRSADTFVVSEPAAFGYVFVRFESAGHVFFLILCPFRSSRVGVYFPEVELVVSRLKLGPLVRGFRSLAVRNAERYTRYLASSERAITIPINTLGHWGHVVLNELEALHWLFETGHDRKIDRWLGGEVGFFDFTEVFPEIPRAKLHVTHAPDERFRWCLQENAFVVHPQIASYLLEEPAGSRLVEHWSRDGERTGATARIADRLAGRFPVIWCEIRANDRLWTNQLEGLQAVVVRLKPRYPNLTLVLAGWSRMLTPSAGDEKMIAHEMAVFETLTGALAGTTCLPVLGVPTGEKLLWAQRCHFHLSLFGSGLLFALLAKLPGVTLVSRYYQEHELFLGDDHRRVHFMYGDDRLGVLPTRFVIDDTTIENGEVRNFRVDAAALASFVEAELAKVTT